MTLRTTFLYSVHNIKKALCNGKDLNSLFSRKYPQFLRRIMAIELRLPLARFKTWIGFINHIHTTFAANNTAITVTFF